MDIEQELAFEIPENVIINEENEIPTNPYEYIMKGRKEFEKLPPVVSVSLPNNVEYNGNSFNNDYIEENIDLEPGEEWIISLLSKFSNLRQYIEYWKLYNNNKNSLINKYNLNEWNNIIFKETNYPFISILIEIDDVLANELLGFILNKINNNNKLLNKHVSLWLFGILSVISKPLTPDNSSLIRDLIRICEKLRSNVVDYYGDELAYLNILITITKIYFVQSEEAQEWLDYIKE